MKRPVYLTLLIFLVVVSYIAGSWNNGRVSGESGAAKSGILYYHCPMHPGFKSDRPGTAPCCGMALEPVYAGGSASTEPSRSLPHGAIHVSPEKQQMIGVRTGVVERSKGAKTLRLLGRIAADETRVYRVRAAVDGWIQEVYPNTVGSLVTKGQPLASFYAPEFLTAEQTYLLAVDSLERFHVTGQETPSQIKLAEIKLLTALDDLRNLGMDEAQIDELTHTRKFTRNIMIRAPQTGFVFVREVSPGERISKGGELYRVAELNRVWILADIYENEGQHYRPGAMAKISHPYLEREYKAVVSDVLPVFDSTTRTLKVRLEADNPGYLLKPDMFVDVELPLNLPASIAIPSEAVLDAGLQKTVFVDLGDGYFEPRRITTGWRMNGLVEVTEGLEAGEKIVISGNFLLDSETRLKATASSAQSGHPIDPVCGMSVDPAAAGDKKSVYQGQTYYFCSTQCRDAFEKEPARYLKKSPNTDQAEKVRRAKDPVCGMTVDASSDDAIKSQYKGITYYFCCTDCKKKFDGNPEHYITAKKKPADRMQTAVHEKHTAVAETKRFATDPVCSMAVDTTQPGVLKSVKNGRTYYFCSDPCRVTFEQEPEKYLKGQTVMAGTAISGDAFSVADVMGTKRGTAVKIGAESYNDVVMAELRNTKRFPNMSSPVQNEEAHQHAAMESKDMVQDPICGKSVNPTDPGVIRFLYQEKSYYFCSSACRDKFLRERAELQRRDREAAGFARNQTTTARVGSEEGYLREPERFVEYDPMDAEMPAASAAKLQAVDPVCGMKVDVTSPGVLKTEHQGKTYYFCSESCKVKFEKTKK